MMMIWFLAVSAIESPLTLLNQGARILSLRAIVCVGLAAFGLVLPLWVGIHPWGDRLIEIYGFCLVGLGSFAILGSICLSLAMPQWSYRLTGLAGDVRKTVEQHEDTGIDWDRMVQTYSELAVSADDEHDRTFFCQAAKSVRELDQEQGQTLRTLDESVRTLSDQATSLRKSIWREMFFHSFPRLLCLFFGSVIGFALLYRVNCLQLQCGDGPREFLQCLYFSIATVTTTGFGDIHPASDFTRVLVMSEIVVGLAFIALIIGAVVTAHRELNEDEAIRRFQFSEYSRWRQEMGRLAVVLTRERKRLLAPARRMLELMEEGNARMARIYSDQSESNGHEA